MRKKIGSLLVLAPLVMACLVAFLFYPGFMSYDTLHALRASRGEIIDSMWPPMVSYIWRGVDLVSTNPSAMHFSQILLVLGSFFFITNYFIRSLLISTLILFIYLCFPPILGTLAVIWKDVLMAGWFLLAIYLILAIKNSQNRTSKSLLLFLLAVSLFLGTATRHNGIFAALPLIFWGTYNVLNQRVKFAFLAAIAVFIVIFAGKSQLDSISLPSFAKINNETKGFLSAVRVLDLAGASICLDKNLFDVSAPDLTLEEIVRTYDPKHINLSSHLLERVNQSDVDEIWFKNLLQHPICMLSNKLAMGSYLVGWQKGPPFLITHPGIDQNEFGYKLESSRVRDIAVGYVISASSLIFFKVWILFIICPVLIGLYFLRFGVNWPILVIYLSGLMYALGLLLFGNAADARLLFYSNTIFIMISLITISNFIGSLYARKKDARNPSLSDYFALEHLSNSKTSLGLVDIRLQFLKPIPPGSCISLYVAGDKEKSITTLPINADDQMVSMKLNTYLLPAGERGICLELLWGKSCLQKLQLSVLVEELSPLGMTTRNLLLAGGAPIFFRAPVDSQMLPNNSYQAWFDRPDALDFIENRLRNNEIDKEDAQLLTDFVIKGFVILENLIDEELIESVNHEIDSAINDGYQNYSYGSSDRIELLHLSRPNVRKLWLDKRHRKVVDLIFDEKSRPCQTLAFVFGSQQEAHQDTIHLTPFPQGYMCGIWIALQDVLPNSGELIVYPGSHREDRVYLKDSGCEKVKDQDWSDFILKILPRWAKLTEKYEPVIYRPKKGTVLIWHENLLHAGSERGDMSLERRSIVIHSFADGCLGYYDTTGTNAIVASREELAAG